MSNPKHIQSYFDSQIPLILVIEEILNDWDGKGCYQLPIFLMKLSAKMNWDDKQLRAKDPLIRDYIRNHPEWVITRGAGGGIMRSEERRVGKECRSRWSPY